MDAQSNIRTTHCSLTPPQFERLRDILATFSGVYLDTARQRVLEQALARRVNVLGVDLATYEQRISAASGRDELYRLTELVLNHETFFFRNKPHIRALREVLLPELHKRKPRGEPLRIWSAGCATGEEAYSLAIVALEALGLFSGRKIEITATDLSEPALAYARAGYYHGRSLTNVPPEILARYFQPHGEGYLVSERVRQFVTFSQLNLLEPLPPHLQGVDIIFCQNVMIYFQLTTSRVILERMYNYLSEGGLLFLGFSETLWNVFDAFRSREVLGAFVYYKEAYQQPTQRKATAPLAGSNALIQQRGTQQAQPPVRREMKPPAPPSTTSKRTETDATVLSQGRKLLEMGEVEAAIDLLRRISPRSADAPQAMALIARGHADRGELDLALAETQRVIEIAPLHDEAYLLLGIIYSQQGLWETAIAQLERARYLNNDSPLVSFYLAEAYRQHGRIILAGREYRNTLRKLEPCPPDTVIDGVAVRWLRETCQRHIERLSQNTKV